MDRSEKGSGDTSRSFAKEIRSMMKPFWRAASFIDTPTPRLAKPAKMFTGQVAPKARVNIALPGYTNARQPYTETPTYINPLLPLTSATGISHRLSKS